MDSVAHRQQLVAKLRADGQIRSTRVAQAFAAVPREVFVPGVPLEEVYRTNEAILIKRVDGVGVSSASAPDVMALMLEQLAPNAGDNVLEIGAGTGYNAALLKHLVGPDGSVTSIELDADLASAARAHLQAAGFGDIQVVEADGALGYEKKAPYDRIVLTVASRDIAPAWFEQLGEKGKFLLPLSVRGVQRCVTFVPANSHLQSTSVGGCAFIPLRGVLAMDPLRVPLDAEGLVTLGLPDDEPPGLVAMALLEQLKTGRESVPTGVYATPEQVRGGLQLWLAAHEPAVCALWAETSVEAVPDLLGQADRFRATVGLLVNGELAVLARQRSDELRAQAANQGVAKRLCDHVRAWQAAGRPTDGQLRIDAYPKQAAHPHGEAQVEQRWASFALSWAS